MSVESVDEYFAGKPESREIFEVIAARIAQRGPSDVSVGSQISFGCNRKFAWFWLYNVTKKNPSGVPHLMLAIDEKLEDPHVREVNRISKNRWNHQIVIRTLDDARSVWLGELIAAAYQYGSA
ncbi:MAG TPA: DUF5655 domain-containing protein [Acidimicrobiia bacterium]